MDRALKIISGLSVLVVLFVVFSLFLGNNEKDNDVLEEISTVEEVMNINVPFASMSESGDFGPFGCGQYLNIHTVQVPATQSVLGAVYSQLFTTPYDISNSEDKNIIASHQNLNFDSVSIDNGIASVYLSGTVMGNHCADEVFRHQIEQAAFQFDTVNEIQVFVNNSIFDWCTLSDADPSESGCDINPRPWIKQKSQ